MALEHTADTPIGLTADNAYHRVEVPEISWDKTRIIFRLRTYARKPEGTELPAFDDHGFECPYDINGPNVFAQAYAWLREHDPAAPIEEQLARTQAAIADARERAARAERAGREAAEHKGPEPISPNVKQKYAEDRLAAEREAAELQGHEEALTERLAKAKRLRAVLAEGRDV